MGSSTTKEEVKIDTTAWPLGTSDEYTSNFFFRTKALLTYKDFELLSFGRFKDDVIQNKFNTEFYVNAKKDDLNDGYRKTSLGKTDKCCFIDENYYIEDGKYYTCEPRLKNISSSTCEKTILDYCINNMNEHKICNTWIKSMAEKGRLSQSSFQVMVEKFLRSYEYIDHEYYKTFIIALREYATVYNNFNSLIDSHIQNIPYSLRHKYKCAFAPEEILQEEKIINTSKECWYKECVFSPVYKLKSENLFNRKTCNILLCDININSLNISKQDIHISCKNTFKSNSVDIKNTPLNKDMEIDIFIPTFKNSILPLIILGFLMFIKI